jgi:hypothetical protein
MDAVMVGYAGRLRRLAFPPYAIDAPNLHS